MMQESRRRASGGERGAEPYRRVQLFSESTAEGRKKLDPIAATNGRDLDGTPILTSPSQIDDLDSEGLVELRTRPVSDPVFRWVICPIPEDPRNGYIRPDAFLRAVTNNGTPVFPALRNNFVCLQQTGDWCR